MNKHIKNINFLKQHIKHMKKIIFQELIFLVWLNIKNTTENMLTVFIAPYFSRVKT